MNPEILEWCNARLRQQRHHNSWTPFIVQTILNYANQHNRPDIAIVQQLWHDFEHGVVPQQPMEIIQ